MNNENPANQEIDLDKEYGGGNSQGVPSFLMVLLVLTTINVVWNIYQTLKDLFVGAESAANIEAEFYSSMEQSGVDMSDVPDWVTTGLMEFMERFSSMAVTIRIVDLIYYLALGVAVVLMYRLRKSGFSLYVAVNILGVIATPVLYGFNFIGITLAILYAIAATIFIALYSANRKHLR